MSSELCTIATFADAVEAHLVRSRLEEEGIAVQVTGELSADALGIGYAFGGVDVQVPVDDLDRARAILEAFAEEVEQRKLGEVVDLPEEFPAPEPTAPEEPPLTPDEARINRAFLASIFGFLVCFPFVHVYALILLLRSSVSDSPTRRAISIKYYVALTISLVIVVLPVMVGAAVLISRFVRGY